MSALLLLASCQEQRLIEKGFDRAAEQYELMYEATPLGMYPRTVNNSGETRLIGAEPLKTGANWTNGFYPGTPSLPEWRMFFRQVCFPANALLSFPCLRRSPCSIHS